MLKKTVMAVLCFLALFGCYKMEQSVYQNATYASYKQQKIESTKQPLTNRAVKETLQQQVQNENKAKIEKESKKIAYLTFDDGPSEVTPKILEALREQGIKATFFLIGNAITKENEELVKEMAQEGHTIGIHTYCHEKNKIYCSAQAYLEDFNKAYKRIYEVTGIKPKIFRFPWGSANNYLAKISNPVIHELESRGFTYFDWNVSAEDSVGTPTKASILNNIKKDYRRYDNPVILMHDSSINELTANTLPEIIEIIKAGGYTFDTLDHMENAYQYPRD